jgi:hypothetical protein
VAANAYPLSWPDGWKRTPDHKRNNYARFKTTFTKARQELFAELDRLGAHHAVVSSWLPLRNDGMPRADAARMRISDPGVAVYFELRGRPMVMARDIYTNVHDNLRSIGLAIEHLRGLERHGGATMMERAFEGFAALPNADMVECFAALGLRADATEDQINAAFRERARNAHPDTGGSTDAMAKLSNARDQALKTKRQAA